MDRGAWRATVHGAAKESDTTEQLSTGAQKPKSEWHFLLLRCNRYSLQISSASTVTGTYKRDVS